MSTRDQTIRNASGDQGNDQVEMKVKHVEDDLLMQRLERIERVLASMDDRLVGAAGSRKVITDKPNVRNWLITQLVKGWVTEAEILEFSIKQNQPWQTIGVRSFMKKLKTQMGIVVDFEENNEVRRWRIRTA